MSINDVLSVGIYLFIQFGGHDAALKYHTYELSSQCCDWCEELLTEARPHNCRRDF